MKFRLTCACQLTLLWVANAANAANLTIDAGCGADALLLNGPNGRQQLLVTAGENRDVTREVKFEVQPAGIVEVSPTGLVEPRADGKATIVAKLPDGSQASLPVEVANFAKTQPMSFPNDIVPIFTRNDCNSGSCHAKTGGQNGFSLSLFGYEPLLDYEGLLNQSRGRRISPLRRNRA